MCLCLTAIFAFFVGCLCGEAKTARGGATPVKSDAGAGATT